MISCQGGGAGHSSGSQSLRSDDGASDGLTKSDKDALDAAEKTYQELKSESDAALVILRNSNNEISADTINVKTGQSIDQKGVDDCKDGTAFRNAVNTARNDVETKKQSSDELEVHLRTLLAKNAEAAVEANIGNILRTRLKNFYGSYRDPIDDNYNKGLSYFEQIMNKCNIINQKSSQPNTP